MIVLASITQPLVDLATNVISDLGVAGIFVLMLLDSACIPTSSEAIMLFAGFKVSDGRFSMFEIVAAGVAGNVVGSWLAYGIGYYGRVELLSRHGKWLHITPKHIAWADRWFERHGASTVFFSRMVPVVRTFISLPAGVARMPFWKFTWLTIAGCIPWVLGFAIAGKSVGDNWDNLQQKLHYVDYFIAALIVGFVGYQIYRRLRRDGGEDDPSEASAPATQDASS